MWVNISDHTWISDPMGSDKTQSFGQWDQMKSWKPWGFFLQIKKTTERFS